MKHFFLFLLMIGSLKAHSQHRIYGQINDSASLRPLDMAEIILESEKDELSVFSDQNGKYTFDNLEPGKYRLIIRYNFTIVHDETIDLQGDLERNLTFDASGFILKEVIISQKAFHKKSDRFTYDVSNSPKAKGSNAFSLLQETPLVSSTDGKSLKILGKSNAVIYINGKKSNMDADAITEYLKNIPSEQLQRIEVITVPGSEFQVEANDGIINIVMKKQLSDGYNGTAKISENLGFYNNPEAGLDFNFRKSKLAVNTGINTSSYKEQEHYILSNGNAEFRNETIGSMTDPNLNLGGNINADYDFSPRQTLGLTYNYRYNKSFNSILEVDNYSDGILSNKTTNVEDALTHNHSVSANYEIKTDSLGSKFSANVALLKFQRVMSNTNETTTVNNGAINAFKQSVPQYIENLGGNFDYIQKTKGKSTWLLGGSYNNTNTDNDTRQDMLTENGYVNNATLSNHFVYEENIIGLYATYELSINEKFSGKIGSRYEITQSEGRVLDKNTGFTRNYKNILPYINLNFNLNEDHSLTYSFSSRIRRPTFWELNPIRRYFTPTNYVQNNPFMLASKHYNQELNYMYKSAFFTILDYQMTKDASGQIPLQGIMIDNKTQVETRFLRYIRTNYGETSQLSLTLGMNKSWFDGIWNTNFSVALEHTRFQGTVSNDPTYVPQDGFSEVLLPYSVNNDNQNILLKLNNTLCLSPKKDLYLGINYWYLSPKQIEMGRLASLKSVDINVKKVWNLWTLMLEVQDIFRTNNTMISSLQDDGYYNKLSSDEYNRQFNVRLTYNFGNQKLEKAREIDAVNSTIKGRL